MENLMQGKCLVLKAKQNASLLSLGFFFRGCLLCFVLFCFKWDAWLSKSHFQLVLIPANVNWEPLFEASVQEKHPGDVLLTCRSGTWKIQEWKMVFWVTMMLDQKEEIIGSWIWKKVGVWSFTPELAGAGADGWCGRLKMLYKLVIISPFASLLSKKIKRLGGVKKP